MSEVNFRCSGPHLWRTRLNGALYVPEQGRHALKLLEVKGTTEFVGELNRLAQLGSPWASAVLGYISLMPDENGNRDPHKAIALCKLHADQNDPYAQFVYAWALVLTGQLNLAIKVIQKSALLGFPPASLDFANFVWNGWGTKERYPSTALELIDRARKVGHKAALRRKFEFYRSGRLGFARRIMGNICFPAAYLWYLAALWCNPISCRVFAFQKMSRPLLRN